MSANVDFLNEALQFVSNTTLPGVFWGVNISLYFLHTQLLYRRYLKAGDERKKFAFTFLCNSVMVLMAGLELGVDTRFMQLSYIDHGGVNGEPMAFLATMKFSSAINILQEIAIFVIPVLNALVQLWRVWILWEMSPYKLAVTGFLSFLIFAEEALQVYDAVAAPIPKTPKELKTQEMLSTVIVATGLAFNLLVTLVLVGRIIVVRMRHNRLMGTISENAKQYTSIVAMLIESYALDSIWTAATVITYALSTRGYPIRLYYISNNTGDQVTVIAFLLVSYRVLLGQAWTPETGRQLSTLRWNRDDPEGGSTDETTSEDRLPSTVTGSRIVVGQSDKNSSYD